MYPIDKISRFRKEYFFLSNFYPTFVMYGGRIYSSSEHLFQALKTTDEEERESIRCTSGSGNAKRLGRQITLRSDWDDIKDTIMYNVVYEKFIQNDIILDSLIKTYPKQLIEGNYYHDNYWGDCYCKRCQKIEGLNKLGHILMKTRNTIIHYK